MFDIDLYTPEYSVAGDEVAIIETSKGTIKVELDGAGSDPCSQFLRAFYHGFL